MGHCEGLCESLIQRPSLCEIKLFSQLNLCYHLWRGELERSILFD